MSEDYKEIYLEPNVPEMYEQPYSDYRGWCPDNVFHPADYSGVEPTKYIREDLYEALKAENAKYKKVIDQAIDTVFALDNPGFVVWAGSTEEGEIKTLKTMLAEFEDS